VRFPKGPLLFVGPHTDDVELGCGGTISRALEEAAEVYVLAFSTAEESRPQGAPRTVLRDEFMAAMRALSVPESHLMVREFPVRHLDAHRQDILDELITTRNKIEPAMVFAPASFDVHQDHQVVHGECLRAFKHLTLWGYELPWNHVSFEANAFVNLESRHIEAKWHALQRYETQFSLGRPYFSFEFVESLARVRGVQSKAAYAEAFEVVRVRI
jgi:LmbE family N-acetylglucosaminyl deacetylase